MSPDEFLALPPSMAFRVLLEAAPGLVAKLEAIPVPRVPLAPKYDFQIYRKDGVTWASECDLDNLRFWRKRSQESADKGGEYAAKDAKRVKSLDAWIAWRRVEPTAAWAGERNNEAVTAPPPSSRPRVHPRSSNGTSAARSDDGNGSGGIDESY